MKKLYRSTDEKQLSGVLGGLSELYNIDVSILRIVVVVSGFFTGGITWLIYLAAAVVMPTDKQVMK
ncbi:Phage shock protein PspC (stress-responsive transcriptional regulator) [Halobacillus karajensis]|uniref:DNA-binding transcriptional activator PspC n=1 Tax=Halobacillus karajensis TaxID=195088 RepID=A0A024P8H7_9BACI|nr:PspC domain-containing protein [Halobacillus karajensis]CDQ20298.1 DNA-binding transcriptional activator PspC [Halobacillus karajensis]CDQ25041.1 DNA-binding transcriptional activator PspC [Halobacillus karajensis]CDQ28598.1 DNA-binding transcriptional activator PspC [Halobacillus karajensis]SEI11798.1 Phage shock protein PspC (stress-responsive transcriptional regulator) [Halobacillus karajensis]